MEWVVLILCLIGIVFLGFLCVQAFRGEPPFSDGSDDINVGDIMRNADKAVKAPYVVGELTMCDAEERFFVYRERNNDAMSRGDASLWWAVEPGSDGFFEYCLMSFDEAKSVVDARNKALTPVKYRVVYP